MRDELLYRKARKESIPSAPGEVFSAFHREQFLPSSPREHRGCPKVGGDALFPNFTVNIVLKHRSSKKSIFLLLNLLKKQIVPQIYHTNPFFEKL